MKIVCYLAVELKINSGLLYHIGLEWKAILALDIVRKSRKDSVFCFHFHGGKFMWFVFKKRYAMFQFIRIEMDWNQLFLLLRIVIISCEERQSKMENEVIYKIMLSDFINLELVRMGESCAV